MTISAPLFFRAQSGFNIRIFSPSIASKILRGEGTPCKVNPFFERICSSGALTNCTVYVNDKTMCEENAMHHVNMPI